MALCLAVAPAAVPGEAGAADARPPVAAPSASRPWHVVQQYVAAWNAHDPQALMQVLDAEVTYFSSSAPAPRQGREQLGQLAGQLLGLIPDLHWKVLGRPVTQGAEIAFEWEFSGTARLPADARSTATTRPVRLRGASFARVRHGRIVYFADYYNGQTMREQLAP